MLIEYVKTTSMGEEPLSDDPLFRDMLANHAMEIEVAEMLANYSRWLESNELPMTHEPEMTKVMVSELQQRLVNSCMQILGPFGQLEEGSKHAPFNGRVEWFFLHSFLTTIGGGTSEIGRNVIAQRGLGLPR
jgi:alkylation response protein AidB-like acyl-CoA dehydrogenase